MFYLVVNNDFVNFGIFQQQQTDVVKFSRLIEFLMWYLVHAHIHTDDEGEREREGQSFNMKKRTNEEQLILLCYMSHSHLFIVRHFIFFCVLSFLFRPCLLSFHLWISLYHIENNVKCITTFYAMEKRREKQCAYLHYYINFNPRIHTDDFRNYNNFRRQKVCPHINCATAFFPFFCVFIFVLFACVTVPTILLSLFIL